MSESFFENLVGHTSFSDACDPQNYTPAPDDWSVVITDVRGSTKAIQEGRYKDVNMVGAACITATVNACKGIDIPYTFGGDGATALVPEKYLDIVTQQLMAVKAFADAMHGLSLRVGVIPMEEILKHGQTFDVAKFEMSTGATIAMFGDGASIADSLLKQDERFLVADSVADIPPNLEGLSCRWKPIPARRDVILTLLVTATSKGNENETYRKINKTISEALDNDANPLNDNDKVRFRWPSRDALRDAKMVWKQGNVFFNVIGFVSAVTLFNIIQRFNIRLPGLNVEEYKKDMVANSDYRKFDGMLRMVLDCSSDQAELIEKNLSDMHQNGEILYGTHYSKTALMTCFVETLEKIGHVHFIDGNDGGYAMAAEKLKKQMLN